MNVELKINENGFFSSSHQIELKSNIDSPSFTFGWESITVMIMIEKKIEENSAWNANESDSLTHSFTHTYNQSVSRPI